MYVPAPKIESILITNTAGEVMPQQQAHFLPDGTPNPLKDKLRPGTIDYQQWLRERLMDDKFYAHSSKKEGIEALELLHLARKQIAETKGKVGVHAFDSEVANRLRACILSPTLGHFGNRALEHNWYDWVMLWKPELSDKPPAVLALEAPSEPQEEKAS